MFVKSYCIQKCEKKWSQGKTAWKIKRYCVPFHLTTRDRITRSSTVCMTHVTKTFLLFRSSIRSKQLLCFVQVKVKKQTKTYNKHVVEFSHSDNHTFSKLNYLLFLFARTTKQNITLISRWWTAKGWGFFFFFQYSYWWLRKLILTFARSHNLPAFANGAFDEVRQMRRLQRGSLRNIQKFFKRFGALIIEVDIAQAS